MASDTGQGRLMASIGIIIATFLTLLAPADAAPPQPDPRVPVLLYHRFGTARDGTTVTTANFESHLAYLRQNGYTVIPLSRLTAWLRGTGPAPAAKSVVITVDDGHASVYREMFPLVRKYNAPVTLFLYPSALSNASYAMTWDQLRSLRATGLFEFQSHTYWHPNFRKERKRLPPDAYRQFVDGQIRKARAKIEKELGGTVDTLAYPFGIVDDELANLVGSSGVAFAFTIEPRPVTKTESPLQLPRYTVPNRPAKGMFELMAAGRPMNFRPGY